MSSPRDDQNLEGLDPTTKLSGLSPQQDQDANEADPSDDENEKAPDAAVLKSKR